MSRHRLFLLALLSALVLSACNTVEGFGRDLSKAGDQLEESAEEEQND